MRIVLHSATLNSSSHSSPLPTETFSNQRFLALCCDFVLAIATLVSEPGAILSLAARRKGTARFAALHLDCARSARKVAYRFALKTNCMRRHFCASWRK